MFSVKWKFQIKINKIQKKKINVFTINIEREGKEEFTSVSTNYWPFYWYGRRIELLGFKEFYGGGMSTIQYTRIGNYVLFGQIVLYRKVFLEKDCKGKKRSLCRVWNCNNDHLFAEKYTLKFCFFTESVLKNWVSAPWASHNTPEM